jgi:hypothetical protein
MSLPKYPPSHSTSPSKSSLRSTSGTGTQKPSSGRGLLPSPHFKEPALARSRAVELERGESELRELDGSSFQPFFTLIEDTLTHTHHHPTVHYIFADDDTDIVSEAACRSLAQDDPVMTTATRLAGAVASLQQQELEVESDQEPSRLPPSTPGVREHYLLLDVQPIGSENTTTSYEVTRAHSLSAEWQVTSTAVSNAPTIDAVDNGGEGADGLMLRIEGRGVIASDDDDDGKSKVSKEKETLDEMVHRFKTDLADIKRAIEAGGSLIDEQEEVGDRDRVDI